MNWTLQSKGINPGDYQMISEDGATITYKYSESQHSIRMRFNDHHGVYVLDEGCFNARKFAVRNVYGSEIGTLIKGTRIENTGTLQLNNTQKFYYTVNSRDGRIEVTTQFAGMSYINTTGSMSEENSLLALIVFSWMQSVTIGDKAVVV